MIKPIVIFVLSLSLSATAADPGAKRASSDRKSEHGAVSLDVCADGDRIHLLVGTRDAGRTSELSYLSSTDGGETWSNPSPVGAGQPAPEPAHRGMDAQIAASGDRLVVVWTTEGKEDRFGRGPMASAYSGDGGKTWSAGPNPADDGAATGHAFVDIAADDQGAFHLVWLDGRAERVLRTSDVVTGVPTTQPTSTGKGLRYARSMDGGASWSSNTTIDAQTCECCWNTIATGTGGKVLVLYRDFAPRDMALARSDDGGRTWHKPATVGTFGWDVNGCPHVGGGLAFGRNPDELFATVWTAKDNDHRGAYTLGSRDGGATWSAPLQLGNADSWHPDIVRSGDRVVAAWDAYVDGGTAAFTASSVDNGRTWTTPLRLNATNVSATHPRLVSTSDGVSVLWTERGSGQGSRWVSKKLAF